MKALRLALILILLVILFVGGVFATRGLNHYFFSPNRVSALNVSGSVPEDVRLSISNAFGCRSRLCMEYVDGPDQYGWPSHVDTLEVYVDEQSRAYYTSVDLEKPDPFSVWEWENAFVRGHHPFTDERGGYFHIGVLTPLAGMQPEPINVVCRRVLGERAGERDFPMIQCRNPRAEALAGSAGNEYPTPLYYPAGSSGVVVNVAMEAGVFRE